MEIGKSLVGVALHVLYAFSILLKSRKWIFAYCAVNVVVFILAITVGICWMCRRRRPRQYIFPKNNNYNSNDTEGEPLYENYYCPGRSMELDARISQGRSLCSMDTEHEFSYFDEIKYHDESGVGAMKLLSTKK